MQSKQPGSGAACCRLLLLLTTLLTTAPLPNPACSADPKPSASLKVQGSQLRRVNSGERWDGTTSFKSRYE